MSVGNKRLNKAIGLNHATALCTLFISCLSIFCSILLFFCPCSAQQPGSYYSGDAGGGISGDVKTFQDLETGFSFQYPASWAIRASPGAAGGERDGSFVEGSLELKGPCERISLNWTRDPGISRVKILAQIRETYDSGEVRVLSSTRDEITVRDTHAEVMSLLYDLKGYRSEKRFAVWNTSKSDRLFLASISRSGCSPELGGAADQFDSLIASFSDLAEGAHVTLGPKLKDGAWTLVLGDLLSSYHYRDEKTLPSRIARIRVLHTLSPVNDTYRLDSQEVIHVDPPEAAVQRAWAVQSLLLKNGYNVRLAQMSGEVGILVLDPSGRWQIVSINPSKPGKSVGVMINGTRAVLVYGGPEELAEDNRMSLQGLDAEGIMQRDCDPSRYVELKPPSDNDNGNDNDSDGYASWRDGLKKVLEGYSYDERYQENVFDCSNTAQICWSMLRGRGYDARLMMSWKGQPLGPHLWVVVPYPLEEERYLAVETANTNGNMELVHLGRIVEDEDYYRGIMYNSSGQYSRLHPEEGLWLEKAA